MIQMLILAIIQGISEWFPISSSGHLVVFSNILGFANTIEFDVALHFGTLMAVFVYFGRDIVDIVEALLKGDWKSKEAKMGLLLVIATIPAVVIGLIFKRIFESAFSSLIIVAIGFAITSVLLLMASFYVPINKKSSIGYSDSWMMGFAQALAIVPGISRSGATISTGLLNGIEIKEAMKFSFLMAIPAVFGASILELGTSSIPSSFIVPTLVSFVVGMLTIHFLLKIVGKSNKNLVWFAIYDFLIAIILILYLLLR